MVWFLSGRGKAAAKKAEDEFGAALRDLESVRTGPAGIAVLQQRLREIQAEVHVRESEIPSLPPGEINVVVEEPDTSPALPRAKRLGVISENAVLGPAVRPPAPAPRPAVPRPEPFRRPIPREEPSHDDISVPVVRRPAPSKPGR